MPLSLQVVDIDNQRDFTEKDRPLYVQGAEEDAKRASRMIKRLAHKITEIHRTSDSHTIFDISHPSYWVLDNGQQPKPITQVTYENGRFHFWNIPDNVRTTGTVAIPSLEDYTIGYIQALTKNGRYPHTIWPEHCIIGKEGHNSDLYIQDAVETWERRHIGARPVIWTKGSHPLTEHFSAIRAEVPYPGDASTDTNFAFVKSIYEADMTIWIGQAFSHCFANTFMDAVANFPDPSLIRKQHIVIDASSNVPHFEHLGEAFLKKVKAMGVNLTTCEDVLAAA